MSQIGEYRFWFVFQFRAFYLNRCTADAFHQDVVGKDKGCLSAFGKLEVSACFAHWRFDSPRQFLIWSRTRSLLSEHDMSSSSCVRSLFVLGSLS